MTKTTDPVARNDWQVIGRTDDIKYGKPRQTRLLGQNLVAERKKYIAALFDKPSPDYPR